MCKLEFLGPGNSIKGIITKYAPIIDHEKLGLGIHAMIFVTVEGKGTDQEELAQKMLHLPGVAKTWSTMKNQIS